MNIRELVGKTNNQINYDIAQEELKRQQDLVEWEGNRVKAYDAIRPLMTFLDEMKIEYSRHNVRSVVKLDMCASSTSGILIIVDTTEKHPFLCYEYYSGGGTVKQRTPISDLPSLITCFIQIVHNISNNGALLKNNLDKLLLI